MTSIFDTIKEASQDLKVHSCQTNGHLWSSEGQGCRPCPHGNDLHSQSVYVCTECGIMDYGDNHGPGQDECHELECLAMVEEYWEWEKLYEYGDMSGSMFLALCEQQHADFNRRLLNFK